jgi:hypothetical protein
MLAVSWDTVRVFLHVLAATMWVGGQITLTALVPVLRRLGAEVPRAAARRFNQVAWPTFAVLVITGIWNIIAVRSRINGSYETTLVVKLIVVAISGISAALHARARNTAGLAVFGALTRRQRSGGPVPRHPACRLTVTVGVHTYPIVAGRPERDRLKEQDHALERPKGRGRRQVGQQQTGGEPGLAGCQPHRGKPAEAVPGNHQRAVTLGTNGLCQPRAHSGNHSGRRSFAIVLIVGTAAMMASPSARPAATLSLPPSQ